MLPLEDVSNRTGKVRVVCGFFEGCMVVASWERPVLALMGRKAGDHARLLSRMGIPLMASPHLQRNRVVQV